MKRLYQLISSFMLLLIAYSTVTAQDNSPWKNYANETVSGVLLAPGAHEYSLLNGQGFLVYLRNDNKVSVIASGILIAKTTCGKIVSTRFKITLAPGEIASGNNSDIAKANGQSGWVSDAECLGVRYAKIPKYINRINNVTLGDVRVTTTSGGFVKPEALTPITPFKENITQAVTTPVAIVPKFDSLGFYKSRWNYTKDSLLNEIYLLKNQNKVLQDTINYKTVIYNNLQNTLLNTGKKKK